MLRKGERVDVSKVRAPRTDCSVVSVLKGKDGLSSKSEGSKLLVSKH